MRFAMAVVAIFIFVRSSPAAVGFQQMEVPDPPNKPLTIGIWYPTISPAATEPLGPFRQDVALDGTMVGTKFPVVFISHGTAGSLASHYDTALALAQAGFVVVALT